MQRMEAQSVEMDSKLARLQAKIDAIAEFGPRPSPSTATPSAIPAARLPPPVPPLVPIARGSPVLSQPGRIDSGLPPIRPLPDLGTLTSFQQVAELWFNPPPGGKSFHELESGGIAWRRNRLSNPERKRFNKYRTLAALLLFYTRFRGEATPADAAMWLDAENKARRLNPPHTVTVAAYLEEAKTSVPDFTEFLRSDDAPYDLQKSAPKRKTRGTREEQAEKRAAKRAAKEQ